MRTCWVLDHPAHVRLLAPFIRSGSTSDLLICTRRFEVEKMIETGDGFLPRRETLWVPRPIGDKRRRKALKRLRIVKKRLKRDNFDQIISIGAPLELRAAKRLIPRRWYISDTEVNHIAHRLAKNAATDIIIPTHWREDIHALNFSGTIHRLDGIHGHIHLRPGLIPREVSNPPKILVRRLKGDGIHDSGEITRIPESFFDGLEITFANENEVNCHPWKLSEEISVHDGVITQSVTLASESALLGTPTLLVSKAQRGFLDRLCKEGYPLFRCEGEQETYLEFLAGLHLRDVLELPDWPDARNELAKLFGMELLEL